MVLKKKRFDELTTGELYELLRVRTEVFVVEQNCVYQDLDGVDYESLHVFFEEEGRVTAYLRLFERAGEPGILRMGRVLTARRGLGVGRRLLKEGIRAAKEWEGIHTILIEAQCYATGFYEKESFRITSDVFWEDGIEHVEMCLEIGDH